MTTHRNLPAVERMDPNPKSSYSRFLVTRAGFRRVLRSLSRPKCFVCSTPALRLTGNHDRYYPGLAHVKVSQRQAIAFVDAALENFEDRGARIEVSYDESGGDITCVFIG